MRTVVAELKSQTSGAPASYGDTGCRLTGMDLAAFSLRHERYFGERHERVYLFAKRSEVGAQVFLHVFPLPAGLALWTRELDSCRGQRAAFRLPGQRFDDRLLAPGTAGFNHHEAFQTRDGRIRQRIIHAYLGGHRGVLLVYSRDDDAFLDSPFFEAVCAGLTLADMPLDEPFLAHTSS